mmetsp:Transcript_22205/g.35599  ORF Transcript_22205/g.35599 Transcript_22205/m.35599 type:complete len:90 (-) Transcript_22205:63-332(-)
MPHVLYNKRPITLDPRMFAQLYFSKRFITMARFMEDAPNVTTSFHFSLVISFELEEDVRLFACNLIRSSLHKRDRIDFFFEFVFSFGFK